MVIDPQIQGRVALVTGANHGIGAAIATALAAQGVRVFLNYLRLEPREDPALSAAYSQSLGRDATAVLSSIHAAGGEAEAWESDLTRPETIPELFDRAEKAFGPVEILVNNADYCAPDSFLGAGNDPNGLANVPLTSETHDAHFWVNSRGPALLIAEFARRHIDHRAAWGRIISITSAGRVGFTGNASYGASKAALESYTFTAASELARFGVTANIVEPMGTDTGWIADELAQRIKAQSPFGHVGLPVEVAEVVLFFVSHQARFLTEQRLQLQ